MILRSKVTINLSARRFWFSFIRMSSKVVNANSGTTLENGLKYLVLKWLLSELDFFLEDKRLQTVGKLSQISSKFQIFHDIIEEEFKVVGFD